MCYSAQVQDAYDKYVKEYGANIDIFEFARLYGLRLSDPRIKIPKAMDLAFSHSTSDDARQIKNLIDQFNQQQTAVLEQELFRQRKRLVDAERMLVTRTTKAATENKRIATDKISHLMRRLSDLQRTELLERDSRIFPGNYAPVMVCENGQRVLRPMRYQCRPAGKPEFFDAKYPGTYNARRDSLGKFWKGLYGVNHAIMVISCFYENVSKHRVEGRELTAGEQEENVVLEFRPTPPHNMLVACLWSRWQAAGEPDLLSFAAITDDPPPEIAAAGHDRCIIPIKPENIDAWLNPNPRNLKALDAILDNRDRPYYEHRLAA